MAEAHHQQPLPLDGAGNPQPGGLDRWHQERERALNALARTLGLPLGHPVELELQDGTRLRGRLVPAEDTLWFEPGRDVRLRIDRCTFRPAEIAACVRLD